MLCSSIFFNSSLSAYPASAHPTSHGLPSSSLAPSIWRGKLVNIGAITHRLDVHDQPVLVIHHTLHVVAGVAPLGAVHDCAVRIGQIHLLPSALLQDP